MGEAWGVICIPTREDFQEFHPDLLAQAGESFLEALFAAYGFQPDILTRGRFKVENSLLVGGTICMQVSDEGWPYFCEHVIKRGVDSELYASTYSEYGQRSFYARNAQGESWLYSRGDDGDEGDPDGLSDGEKKWLALVDEELRTACPPLMMYLRDRDFADGGFDWDRYVPERHDGKLNELRESLASLQALLSKRTVEACAQFIAELAELPASDPSVVNEARSFLEEDLEGFVQVLTRCATLEPSTFFGEWIYGFTADDTEPEGLPRSLKSPRFAHDEITGTFLLVPQ